MPAVSYALTTKAKVKEYLGITGTAQDAFIDNLINVITDWIESYCGGRRFFETQYTNEEYDVPNGDIVFLRQFPVSELTVAEFRTGTIANPTFVSFNTNDFLLYKKEGYIKFFFIAFGTFQGLTIREKLLRFTYKAGFKIDFTAEGTATHTLPFDLTFVATQLVARLFNLRNSQGLRSESTEGQSVTYDTGEVMTIEQKAILEKYKKHQLTI